MTEFSNFSVIAFDENMPFYWAYRAVLFLIYYLMFLEAIFKKIVFLLRKLLKSPFVKRITAARLSQDSRSLHKLPEHLALIINEEAISFMAVANFILWTTVLNINYISVYDPNGYCKKNRSCLEANVHKVQEKLMKNKKDPPMTMMEFTIPGSIVHSGKRKQTIQLLSEEDGCPLLADVARGLCHEVQNDTLETKEITVQNLDDRLRRYSSLPDPDMAIVFGKSQSTLGFMPWHLRLTEIFFTTISHSWIDYDDFFHYLQKFAGTVQRVGK